MAVSAELYKSTLRWFRYQHHELYLLYKSNINASNSNIRNSKQRAICRGIWKSRKWKWNGNWKRKMEMEIGNGNIKVAGLLAALIDLCCCWLVVCMHLELSQPPVYLASFGVGTSNATLESSLASFPGLPRLQFCILQVIKNWSRGRPGNEVNRPRIYPSATSLVPRPSRT